MQVAYGAQEGLFRVCFDAQKTGLEEIFAESFPPATAGQDYLPRMVPESRCGLRVSGFLTPAAEKQPQEWQFPIHTPEFLEFIRSFGHS